MCPKHSRKQENAIKILNLDNTSIINSLCECDEIEKTANTIILSNPTNDNLIGKLMMVIEKCLSNFPEMINGHFSFLPNLLSISHDYSVQLFFHFCYDQSNAQLFPIHEFCESMNFLKKALIAFNEKRTPTTSLSLIIFIFSEIIKNNQFLGPGEVQQVINSVRNCHIENKGNLESHELQKEIWNFYNSLLINSLCHKYLDSCSLVEEGISELDVIQDHIFEYHVEIIHFLSKYINTFHSLGKDCHISNLLNIVSRILSLNQCHTFFLLSIKMLISSIIKNMTNLDFQNVNDVFIKKLLKIISRSENPAILSFSYDIINFCLNHHDMSCLIQEKRGLYNQVKEKIENHNRLLTREYGFRKILFENSAEEPDPVSSPKYEISV